MNTRIKPQNHLRLLATLIALIVICAGWVAYAASPTAKSSDAAEATKATKAVHFKSSDWIVDASTARGLIDADAVTVLDTRNKLHWIKGHVPGARRVAWKDFSRTAKTSTSGLLKGDAALTRSLQALGVSASRPVLVVGNPPDNWGEDGRIVWMLRALGHPKVALVDGGQAALANTGLDMSHAPGDGEAKKGDFVAKKTGRITIGRDTLKKRLGGNNFVALDTREQREFDGKTPYGESRGGHVPGAKHLHYTDLLRADGRLLAPKKLKAKLASLGIRPDTEVAAYCTGGVRSGWVTVVLQQLGYTKARNYAGSMWEWSAQSAEKFPLVK